MPFVGVFKYQMLNMLSTFVDRFPQMAPRTHKRLQERNQDTLVREAPISGPLFDDLTRTQSAKELKEQLETRVL